MRASSERLEGMMVVVAEVVEAAEAISGGRGLAGFEDLRN